ncbi:MAG: hypothetical protein Q8J69_08010 [Sphingobacteriaceae bacterium]|nr:hypothetical protein [Sphingobacteriaceae bacterium]
MNLDLLLSFVQAPQKMADHPVSDLEGMVAEYPYFSAAQLLLLKQYKLQNSSKFNKQLRHVAAVLPDRKQLYRLIEIWPEEVAEVLAADVEVEVVPVPAAQPVFIQEEPRMLLDEPIELAAPLSEVPLEQLEAVQGIGKEAAAQGQVVDESTEVLNEQVLADAIETTQEEVLPQETAETTDPVAAAVDENEMVIARQDFQTEDEVAAESEEKSSETTALPGAQSEQDLSQNAEELATTAALEADESNDELMIDTEQPVEEWPVLEDTATEEALEVPAVQSDAPLLPQPDAAIFPTAAPVVPPERESVAPSAASSSSILAGPADTTALPKQPEEVAAFIAKPHNRLSWFKFFAGKPLREQSDEVLDQLYQEHMQQDLLRAPEQDQQISAMRAQINRDEEVPSSKALEEEIRRLAYESISDDELPASETLAGIYAAQHDYKKAIRIYQKLILKFPDKMSYFARLIEELRAKS